MEGLLLHVDERNESVGDIRYLELQEGQLRLFTAAATTLIATYDLEPYYVQSAVVANKVSLLPHQFRIELYKGGRLARSLRFAAPSADALLAWRNAIHHWRRKVFDASPVTRDEMIADFGTLLEYIETHEVRPRKRTTGVSRRWSLASIKTLMPRRPTTLKKAASLP
ncbi:hypothetical protein ACHHYP_14498 [Achlya hypogyna]|uniref:PH domain-containing protein n=1 Tax=Achlya hypogyna TaxID=1202772 RepID=A0A1V9YD51_ACHHY|nr:hypothetical protein ACHHYP_14498 [Achlya hypogyna]